MAFAALSQLPRGDCGSGYGPLFAALVIVPLTWFFYVVPSGPAPLRRASLAGATCALVASLIFYEKDFALFTMSGKTDPGDFAGGIADAFAVGWALVVHAPAGALLGLVVGWMQVHVPATSLGPRPQGSPLRSRALTSSMIAILAAPIVAVLAAHPLSAVIRHFYPYANGLSPYLVITWLVTVPIAAMVGRHLGKRAALTNRSSRGVPASPQ